MHLPWRPAFYPGPPGSLPSTLAHRSVQSTSRLRGGCVPGSLRGPIALADGRHNKKALENSSAFFIVLQIMVYTPGLENLYYLSPGLQEAAVYDAVGRPQLQGVKPRGKVGKIKRMPMLAGLLLPDAPA